MARTDRMTVLPAVALLVAGAITACGGDSPAAPATGRLVRVEGHGQVGLTGVPLPESLTVRLVGDQNRPLSGRTVRWTATGSDSLSDTSTQTDSNGVARVLWILGLDPGQDTVIAAVGQDTVTFVATARLAVVGERYDGRRNYVSYEPGTLPLILSAPHGGTTEPEEVPDRTSGTMVRDVNTDLLAQAVANALETRLGARPHLIIDHLHRRKMDANRDLPEATGGNPLAEHAWLEFQAFIDHARRQVAGHRRAGLYVDLHGHGHEILRLELGYLLDNDDLALSDDQLADPRYAAASSIRRLAEQGQRTFPQLVRGPESLGGLFQNEGVPAVPSPAQPDPGDAPFFSGGYNTWRHGSREGGVMDGVQIETHRVGVRDSPENRSRFAAAAAAVLQRFLETHYGFEFGTAWHRAPYPTTPGPRPEPVGNPRWAPRPARAAH